MDQSRLAELAPDIADDFTAETVNNQVDNMPVKPAPVAPPAVTKQQKIDLWQLLTATHNGIEAAGGISQMASTIGIKEKQAVVLLKQFGAVIAERRKETSEVPE